MFGALEPIITSAVEQDLPATVPSFQDKAPHIVIAQSNRIVLFAVSVIARFVLARLSSRPDRCYQRGGRGALRDITCLTHAPLSFTAFTPIRICPAPIAVAKAMPVIACGVCSARTESVLIGRGCVRTAVLDVRTARKTALSLSSQLSSSLHHVVTVRSRSPNLI